VDQTENVSDEGRVLCAGGVVIHDGQLLVVLRAHDPEAGRWSIPGGRVDVGESTAQACAREVREETGLTGLVGGVAGEVERAGPAGSTYVITDHLCHLVGGSAATAGSDAAAVAWVTRAELDRLPCVAELVETLDAWGILDQLT
jgi:ADP-ribose pyrophosphatase YjhB (NUDIX family)